MTIQKLKVMQEAVAQPSMLGGTGADAIRQLVPTVIDHDDRLTAIENAIAALDKAIAHYSKEVK